MKNDKRSKRSKRPNIWGFVFIVLMIYTGTVFMKQESIIRQLNNEKLEKKKEVKVLEKQIGEIKDKIDKKSDIKVIEKFAREELKMVRPNEIIYIDKNQEKQK
ncbi:septum formation initiator [Gottschalkia purinilytica]|uniref:Septum formation initiator n=1 Tax=Gottschalkia purinilytica TaxID=1503 RepID=A0A0L0W928_GOTPU|nr:septum formation initiator family protein [Gottschalkia purinilytica]KNF07815.1 septum formation initiator [Gottschalkia purinilytica]